MQSARSQRALIIMFLFVVICFGYLSFRGEQRDNDQERMVYDQCVVRKNNVDRTTLLYSGLIAVEQKNPFQITSPATVKERIRLYTQAIPITPVCGKKP